MRNLDPPTRTVVLVHGIFDTAGSLRKMERHLEPFGFRALRPALRPNSARTGLDTLAMQLRDFIDAHVPGDEPFDLVGFSMGGLIGRYYLQRLDGLRRVRRFVSISTPHHGSRIAYLLPNRGCRQMRPGSDFLADLNRDVDRLAEVRVVSIWTPFDLSIVPARSSRLSVGTEHVVPVKLHRWMLRDRLVLDIVARALD